MMPEPWSQRGSHSLILGCRPKAHAALAVKGLMPPESYRPICASEVLRPYQYQEVWSCSDPVWCTWFLLDLGDTL